MIGTLSADVMEAELLAELGLVLVLVALVTATLASYRWCRGQTLPTPVLLRILRDVLRAFVG